MNATNADAEARGSTCYEAVTPNLDEVCRLAKTGRYRRVPVMLEMLADELTTIEAMRRVRATQVWRASHDVTADTP
jgi:hypothetical protein